MAKRLGANSKRKSADRKIKVRSTVRKLFVKIGVFAIIIAVAALIGLGGFRGIREIITRVQKSKTFNVTAITVQGNNHVDSKTIMEKSGLLKIEKIYSIKESNIKASLSSNPWIENVNVVKRFGGKVIVSITERKPVAMVSFGKVSYIDKNGYIFPLAKKAISEMPLFCGLKDTVVQKGIRKIRAADMSRVNVFLKAAYETDKGLLHSITQVDFSDKEQIHLSFQAYPTIVYVSLNNIESRFRYLQRIEEMIVSDSSAPKRINLCYQNLAFITDEEREQDKSVQTVAD